MVKANGVDSFSAKCLASLRQLALAWCHGDSELATDAVAAALKYARDNPGLIPLGVTDAEHWLSGVLRNRVLCLTPRKRFRPNDARGKLSYVPKGVNAPETGTAGHYLASNSEVVATDLGDSIFDELKLSDRELLFPDTFAVADWRQRKQQAELRERLKAQFADYVQLSQVTRLLHFVSQFAPRHSLKDYLSQFRTLDRRFGKPVRLRNLTPEFYERYVLPLPRGSRKRIVSIWNVAAKLGLVNRPLPGKAVRADHPKDWPDAKLARFCKRADELSGEVLNTAIPNSEYWPAMVCLAADSRLNLRQLRQLTWPQVKAADWHLRPRTVNYLAELERWKCGPIVFPWFRSQASFWKNHARILRRCGVPNELTPRERDVLLGTATGQTEKDLAKRMNCCEATIRQYRQKLREKLGLPFSASLRSLAREAKRQGLLPADLSIDRANQRIYRKRRTE